MPIPKLREPLKQITTLIFALLLTPAPFTAIAAQDKAEQENPERVRAFQLYKAAKFTEA